MVMAREMFLTLQNILFRLNLYSILLQLSETFIPRSILRQLAAASILLCIVHL